MKFTDTVEDIQKTLQDSGLYKGNIDGLWGPLSQGAMDELLRLSIKERSKKYKASSFADDKDIQAFNKCKKTGKSDIECFKVGDNGIGQWGDLTAQEHTPMCALHRDDMIKQWGSEANAKHRKVEVKVKGTSIVCIVADRMSAKNRIDLNPAAAKQLGLKPPFLVDSTWRKI
jgi:hypothetical protein